MSKRINISITESQADIFKVFINKELRFHKIELEVNMEILNDISNNSDINYNEEDINELSEENNIHNSKIKELNELMNVLSNT